MISQNNLNTRSYGYNIAGYALYGPYIVRAVRASRFLSIVIRPLARAILAEECRLANPSRHPFRLGAFISHKAFVWGSNAASVVGRWINHSGYVEDVNIVTMLKRNNLFYTWRNS